MMEILRNMWRRKFRTILTMVGIAVGIFAFTVMGSMALRFNRMIDGGKRYITGQITIIPKGTNFMAGGASAMLPLDTLKKIEQIEGVEAVAASIELPLTEPDPDNPVGGASFGPPPSIEGFDLDSKYRNRNWTEMPMKEGRMLEKGDPDDVVAIGISIATDKKKKVGDLFEIRGRQFRVIGVIDRTMTGPDAYVFMPIKPARELLIASNPFLKSLQEQANNADSISEQALAQLPEETRKQILAAKAFKTEDITTTAGVSWEDGADSEVVSQRIKEQFKNEVLVLSPKRMGEEIDKASVIFNAVILGSALMALIIGGFSIINTMVMSISERTREIGIKKALGASGRVITGEYTLEAGVIGLVGGLLGMGFGLLLIILLNRSLASKGAEIFLIDAAYLSGVVVFSFILGILAGILPAIRASKMRAVDAIRQF